ncbi:dihydrouridine synthase [Annulohypoxylon maeteangense]|uniref:dihydrouridine synthase n=1 Tax=Annulohypoxylon maeteangense TaxID=1927788 RepID=UPI002008D0CA|nr:dihydrouridine synthase [Annulohypoxylon maeteangense]KAI0880403.1 dihydrouridine synthase [Annulohypoxylon maeteangense]
MSWSRYLMKLIMAPELKRVPIPRNGVDYRGKIVLAPMVRSGELPSRLLALHYGADLVWGPETVDRSMIGTTRRFNPETRTIEWTRKPSLGTRTPPTDVKDSVIYRMHPEKEGRKLIFQIGTSNPDYAVQAARLVAADVAGIDVNAGCPKPFSTHDGMGAALLRTPDKLCSILEALVQNITPEFEIGISVKIRILETAQETEALVRRLVATGITGLTVHCRTTPMRPRERAIRGQLRMVADICREAGVACIMNGDVEDRDQGLELMEEYGADGAMIATQAERNPSCFKSRADGGFLPWNEVVEQYIRYAMEVENKFGNTKFLLCQLVPGKQYVYRSLSSCKSYTQMCELLDLDHLIERAREVDISRDIDPDTAGKKDKKVNNSALAAGGSTGESRSKPQTKKGLSERGARAQGETQLAETIAVPT